MIDRFHDRERLDMLLADRALFGLSRDEHAELESLLPRFPEIDPDCFDRTAAAVELAIGVRRSEPLPKSVEAALRRKAAEHLLADGGGVEDDSLFDG
jgi:hypothetical protein